MNSSDQRILAIDIGGTNIKSAVLDSYGNVLEQFQKLPTPSMPTPENVVAIMVTLARNSGAYDRVSVGFPGFVRKGIVHTAPNLGTDVWRDVNFNKHTFDALGKPVRIINDADMQALAIASGNGLEMVITLGTGFGSALLLNGNLLPHIELAHHTITEHYTYDSYVGNEAFQSVGKELWNGRMSEVITMLRTVFNYDRLYIGGGNARHLERSLADNVELVSNSDGIKGGSRLWQLDDDLFMKASVENV